MKREDLYARLLEIAQSMFDTLPPAEEITPDSRFSEDLNMESLDLIDFIMQVETAFDVHLEMANAKNTHTINDIMELLIQEKPELCDAQ